MEDEKARRSLLESQTAASQTTVGVVVLVHIFNNVSPTGRALFKGLLLNSELMFTVCKIIQSLIRPYSEHRIGFSSWMVVQAFSSRVLCCAPTTHQQMQSGENCFPLPGWTEGEKTKNPETPGFWKSFFLHFIALRDPPSSLTEAAG